MNRGKKELNSTIRLLPDIRKYLKHSRGHICNGEVQEEPPRIDSRKSFEYLSNRGVEAVILTRSNSRSLSRGGSTARGMMVRRIREIGLEEWKREVDYGKRWRVEIFFSALKRTMGEVIMANKLLYQIQQAIMKIYAYFLMRKNTVVN